MIRHENDATTSVRDALDAHRALARAIHNAHTADWAALDLTMGQLKGLMALASTGAMNVSELACWLKASKPAASVLVDKLVNLGLAAREEDHEDRRRTLVMLTPQGRELIARLQETGGTRMERWLVQLSDDDRDALTRGLRALTAVIALDAHPGPDATDEDEGCGAADARVQAKVQAEN